MLQQQLRQRDEDLAVRQAEIGELKERVAELENLQQQQQQLLAMKDSELAAAQQRLAETRKAEAAAAAGLVPAPATTQPAGQAEVTAQASQADPPASASNAMPWIWGSLALLGLALLAWVLRRRSAPAAVTPRRAFDSESLAASMLPPMQDGRDSATAAHASASASVQPGLSAPEALDRHPVIDLNQVPSAPSPRIEAPAWHSGNWVKAASAPAAAVLATSTPSFVQSDQPAEPAPQASAAQRLKLAVAFLDIGDDASAEQLLRELLDDVDPAARAEAARMLRELG